ncbi:MAG: EF-hand domain-containing protein [Brevundimonas sp.]
MRSPLLCSLVLLAGACAAAPSYGQNRDPLQMLQNADTNRDGVVTREEFQAARNQLFDRLDRNRDGYLSSADASGRRMRGGRAAEMLERMTTAFDANNDGRVSRGEFVYGPAWLFDQGDQNGDGRIDQAEMQALRAAADQRRSSP